MAQAFGAFTVGQLKIARWLALEGVSVNDIAKVDYLSDNSVKITNPAGQYMILIYENGNVRIDMSEEVRA